MPDPITTAASNEGAFNVNSLLTGLFDLAGDIVPAVLKRDPASSSSTRSTTSTGPVTTTAQLAGLSVGTLVLLAAVGLGVYLIVRK